MRMPPLKVFRRSPAGRRALPDPVPTDFAAPDTAATPAGSAATTDTRADDGGPVPTPGATDQPPAGGAPDSGAPDSGAPDSGAPDSGAPDSGQKDTSQDTGRRLPAGLRPIRPCTPGDAEYALPLPAG